MAELQAAIESHALSSRGMATIKRSRERITAGETRIRASTVRLLPLFRGSADDANGYSDSQAQRKRLILTLPQDVPKIYAGRSVGNSTCDICGRAIMLGMVEYDAEFSALTIRLDRNCFAMWQSEVARN